ncbi:hypothetical protein NQ015_10865 [Corynebacterium sp. 153RC1]|uniref:hypothetical protein n=1 Tax=Corynebacterium sp. 142RC1 TaxID=2968465 RepID=UPI00211D0576|nr:hypothetical protein [Corynebacterium sp. 142RC1]MCQ9362245.1 hypothetical protein [Corynebacterium sp. 153RC1]
MATVQTLSRLNRTYPGKTAPMVVDFANDAESILAEFKQFYTAATLAVDVEPSALFEVAERIDGAGFYTDTDIDAVAAAVVVDDVDHETFRSHISPIVQRSNDGLRAARMSGNEDEVNRHNAFRTDLCTYVKSWEFLSQIVNFEDTTMRSGQSWPPTWPATCTWVCPMSSTSPPLTSSVWPWRRSRWPRTWA